MGTRGDDLTGLAVQEKPAFIEIISRLSISLVIVIPGSLLYQCFIGYLGRLLVTATSEMLRSTACTCHEVQVSQSIRCTLVALEAVSASSGVLCLCAVMS